MHCHSWGDSRLGRRWLLAGLLLLATMAAVLLSLTVPLRASAATDGTLTGATPTPAPSPTASATLAITSPASSDLITTGSVPVSGTGQPGDQVQVFYGGSEEPFCIASVAQDSTWTCPQQLALASGPHQSIVARVIDASAPEPSASITIDVIAPPTVLGPAQTNGQVKGSGGYPNATVTVTVQGGAAAGRSCLVKADRNGNWACFLSLPTGTYGVSAVQKASFAGSPSSPSPALSLHVDADAPAAPVVTSPASGSAQAADSRVAFAGTGEDGASVSVYVRTKTSGSVLACTATVTGATWACTSPALPAGSFIVSALQTDAVGNTSTASAALPFTVGGATPPSSPPSSAATPPTPGASPSHRPTSPSTTPSSPQAPSTSTPAPAPAPGAAPPPAEGPDGSDHWLTSAPFASSVAPTIDAAAFPGWLRSLLLAVVAVLLLALPARLLAGTLAHAPASAPRARLFGRNRPVPVVDDSDASAPPQRWLAGVTLLVATAAIVTLSSAATGQSAYLRLLAAAAVAVAIVNTAWALIGIRAGRHFLGASVSLVLAPRALAIVAACALLSRFAGLSPALLFGLVVGVAAGHGPTAADQGNRGRLAAMQIAGLSALGVLAWMVTGALPPAAGPFTAFAAEMTNAVAIVAIGSAAVSLLPLGRLAGRAVFAWSRPIWLGLSLAVGTVLFALLVPVGDLWSAGGGGVMLGAASLAFAALSVATWLWVRYIEPVR